MAIGLSRVIDYMSSLCRHDNTQERTVGTFSRQALQIVWDYSELNPLSKAVGSWTSMFERRILTVIQALLNIPSRENAIIFQSSATSLPYNENYFDVVFTDPPYYDNVPYSYLSDFFYVWLKRTVGKLYPDLFATPLTPKSDEIVAYTINKTWNEAKKNFEEGLKKSFKEIHRVLRAGGIVTIVYTHKSTSGWEALINSLLESGLVITASWPIHTEMQERLRARSKPVTEALKSGLKSFFSLSTLIMKSSISSADTIETTISKSACIPNRTTAATDAGIRAIKTSIITFLTLSFDLK